jgi:DGQHR domain-containing protein
VAERRPRYLERQALRLVQDPKHPVYMLVLSPEDLLTIANVSRAARNSKGSLVGYQRAEVRKHVQNITSYLDSNRGQVLFPHAPIVSLPSSVRFRKHPGRRPQGELSEMGTLLIPRPAEDDPKPAWIVDGQQRILALSRSKQSAFPVPVCAFVADDVATQREQFLRVNAAKPLPRGLILELLPQVATTLPPDLSVRRAPSAICEALNRDPSSPFHGLIKRSSMSKTDRKRAVVNDTTLIQIFEESFSSPSGALFAYRSVATGQTDYDRVQRLLSIYWSAVREAFPDAWGQAPASSRLMHSVGLRAMGKLMDRVMATVNIDDRRMHQRLRRDLATLRPHCSWTSGTWADLGGIEWNALQNVPAHLRLLSNHLLRHYLAQSSQA